jgi:hypothetical protein
MVAVVKNEQQSVSTQKWDSSSPNMKQSLGFCFFYPFVFDIKIYAAAHNKLHNLCSTLNNSSNKFMLLLLFFYGEHYA